jgi:hypothetical protein
MLSRTRRKKNMARTLKLVSAIFFLFFLVFITDQEFASGAIAPFVLKPTTTKCNSAYDCPEITSPKMTMAVCIDGFCQDLVKYDPY